MPSGAIAHAHARIRGCKSRLLTRAVALPLFLARDVTAMQRVVATLELDERKLSRVYATAMRGYPRGASLFRALQQLHEIEDVKRQWRETVKRGGSVRELAEKLGTFADIARVHGTDIAAAELAFDRWASQRLIDEAHNLPRREALARALIESLVRERDAEIVRRGAKWYGFASITGSVPDVVAMRKERLRLCRRAFVGSPFLLATPLAVILLAEEEARAVRALVERCGDETLDPPLLRALAGSQLGA